MIINVVGECDNRPVIYTLMKILQTIGDTLLVSNNSRLIRLSDTRENFGHYQNCMIAITQESFDDFLEEFPYGIADFTNIILDNLQSADADLTIYVKGIIQSEDEQTALEYIDEYLTIELFDPKFTGGQTLLNCERFEALANMMPINPSVATKVANAMAQPLNTAAENLIKIATAVPPGVPAAPSDVKGKLRIGGKR